MYFYYMIAAMGPNYQKYIWWKKYLTAFQMVQFVAIFIHQFQLLFRECDYPKGFMVWIGLHGAMFLFLFSDFYKTKYTSKPNKAASLKNGTSNGTANGVSSNVRFHLTLTSHVFCSIWHTLFERLENPETKLSTQKQKNRSILSKFVNAHDHSNAQYSFEHSKNFPLRFQKRREKKSNSISYVTLDVCVLIVSFLHLYFSINSITPTKTVKRRPLPMDIVN